MNRRHIFRSVLWIGAFLSVFVLASCGGAGNTNAPTDTVASGNPTENTNSSGAPATIGIPTFQFVEPTVAAQVATAVVEETASATAEATSVSSEAVDRGRGRYEALACAECHGENGEGNDKGPSLLDYDKSLDDFVGFMRSGGSMGSEHQYSTNRLSQSGSENLYQYLLSLHS